MIFNATVVVIHDFVSFWRPLSNYKQQKFMMQNHNSVANAEPYDGLGPSNTLRVPFPYFHEPVAVRADNKLIPNTTQTM